EGRRGTGNVGERGGDQTAGAALGGNDGLVFLGEDFNDPFARINLWCGFGCHQSPLGISMLALAMDTIPSSRPINPSFSFVVALMATRDVAIPSVSAMTWRIAGTCSVILGASATIVTSRLTMRPPA